MKWLGDGVMFHFTTAQRAVEAPTGVVHVVAATEMAPTHVGIHSGPVILREGDYYGQTINVAARIGDVARPCEVLVSQAVVDMVDGESFTFTEIGPVELKGVAGPWCCARLGLVERAEAEKTHRPGPPVST